MLLVIMCLKINVKPSKSTKTTFIISAIWLPILIFCSLKFFHLNYLINIQLDKVSIISLVLISPIWEELVFRGLLQEWLQKLLKSTVFLIFIVNLLFMVIHYFNNHNLLYLLAIFCCGVIFSIIKLYLNRIFYPILLHSYYNLTLLFYVLHL